MRQFLLSTIAVLALGFSGAALAADTNAQVAAITPTQGPAYNQPDDAAIAAAQLRNTLINSTVLVRVPNGSGSGTLFKATDKNGGEHTLVLTNAHVVADIVAACAKTKASLAACKDRPPVVAIKGWVTRGETTYPVIYAANIMLADTANDLALLQIKEDWAGDVAEFAPADLKLYQSEEVYEVGSPLGERTQITSGLLGLLKVTEQGQDFIGISATTIPGNSGGGVYVKRSGKFYLIGVPTAVLSASGTLTFTHGLAIPVDHVRVLLAHLGLTA